MKTYECSTCGLTDVDLADLVDPDLFFGHVDGQMLCNTCLKPAAPTEPAEDLHLCHITAPHGAHDWMPMVPEPGQDRVFHIGLATLRCGGRR